MPSFDGHMENVDLRHNNVRPSSANGHDWDDLSGPSIRPISTTRRTRPGGTRLASDLSQTSRGSVEYRTRSPDLIDIDEETEFVSHPIKRGSYRTRDGSYASGPSSDAGDPYDLTLLMRENAKLRAENLELRAKYEVEESSKWQILYRNRCFQGRERTYTDRPIFVQHDNHDHVDSFRRIPNESTWEESHKDAPFVVYKRYKCRHNIDGLPKPEGSVPEVTGEEVRILNRSLRHTVEQMFRSDPGLEVYEENGVMQDHVIKAPYVFLFHFEVQIRRFAVTCGLDRQPLELLIQYMHEQSMEEKTRVQDLFSKGLVTASLMPYLYSPTGLLVSKLDGELRVLTQTNLLQYINASANGTQTFILSATTIVYDGDFHLSSRTLDPSISDRDEGGILITELSVYPIRFLAEETRRDLLDRGRMFFQCRDQLYGTCSTAERDNQTDLSEVRYMVDVRAYYIMHGDEKEDNSDDTRIASSPDDESFLLQLPATIPGFRMMDKRWVNLRVSDIKGVKWNDQAFEALVIQNDQEDDTKQLIRALVQNKIEADKGIDFVEGKGTGLILLLHGAPGTGKTLTAESVAEIAQRPLYRVTCGDVGTNPEQVEAYLESVFMLGRRWGCVVLLDEADVFLEERSLDNLERNALVSVFLRAMEYYDGILILTSNRVGHFDEAFKSRVQLALPYKPLNEEQRRKIWGNFINMLQKVEENMDIEEIRAQVPWLASHEMNGRQIRNALNTARQLARFSKVPMGLVHLRRAIKVSQQFDEYIASVKHPGMTQEDLAREKEDR